MRRAATRPPFFFFFFLPLRDPTARLRPKALHPLPSRGSMYGGSRTVHLRSSAVGQPPEGGSSRMAKKSRGGRMTAAKKRAAKAPGGTGPIKHRPAGERIMKT